MGYTLNPNPYSLAFPHHTHIHTGRWVCEGVSGSQPDSLHVESCTCWTWQESSSTARFMFCLPNLTTPPSPCAQHTTTQAGGYVKESVVHNLISLVSNAEELQPYAVRRLHSALVDALAGPGAGEPSLLYAAAWCIGEYGEMLPTGERVAVAAGSCSTFESSLLRAI
jgi:hypothetical protein